MNNKLIVANWKMNPATALDAGVIFNSIKEGISGASGIDVVVCPPFVYITQMIGASAEGVSRIEGLSIGGQNCFWELGGAYTGEVSAGMLKSLGCEYVIVGHSERKQYFGESNDLINKKVRAALKEKLSVVICIGENTRDSFDSKGRWTKELDPGLEDQIVSALDGVKKFQMSKISIAYEPVWAIGTGNPATPDDVFSVKLFVQKMLSELYDRKTAESVRILYGGSTNKKNAGDFIKEGRMDGLLVGGASLDAREFVSMIKAMST